MEADKMPRVALRDGTLLPAIGQGTWMLGDVPERRRDELAALAAGLAAGATLIDTAEMYGNGASERLVGRALHSLPGGLTRADVAIVSKVLPEHARRAADVVASCERSLERLGTTYLDLYLLHWRGQASLPATIAGMEELRARGKIRAWGVSNFDTERMEELWALPGGSQCMVNQVLYHAGSRGIEYRLLPWMRAHGVALMAYCPLAQAGAVRSGLFEEPVLIRIARKHGVSVPQVLLSWAVRDGHTIAIPRTGSAAHARENAAAGALVLDAADLAAIDEALAPPAEDMPLDMV